MSIKETKYSFLLQQYKNDIYNYSIYMLQNKFDAEDVTQEVLIKIWKNLGKFNILAAKAWIIKTTHNLCIDQLRKRNVSSNREFSIDEDMSEIIIDKNRMNDPMVKSHTNIMIEKIKSKIEKLPENLRSVFVLYEIHGLKYREISKSLGIPINSVKVYLMRARKQIQKELKHYELQEVI